MFRAHFLTVLFILAVGSNCMAGTDLSGITEDLTQSSRTTNASGLPETLFAKSMLGGTLGLGAIQTAPSVSENKTGKLTDISVLRGSGQQLKRILTPGDVEPALRDALSDAGTRVHLQIVDLPRFPLPFGQIHFEREGATVPALDHPEAPFLWRGAVTAADGRTYPFSVRVRAWISVRAVRTKVGLRAGQVISEGDIEECDASASPLSAVAVANRESYQGRVVRRTLRAGTTLQQSMVQDPPRIPHGTLVSVLVHSGSAQLKVQARANVDGRVGQRISLTNLDSHRNFAGTVLDDGTVSVEASLGANLK